MIVVFFLTVIMDDRFILSRISWIIVGLEITVYGAVPAIVGESSFFIRLSLVFFGLAIAASGSASIKGCLPGSKISAGTMVVSGIAFAFFLRRYFKACEENEADSLEEC